jgi:hypothetical protein
MLKHVNHLFIQKQEGRGSDVLRKQSVTLLHEYRKNESDDEIFCISMNKTKNLALNLSKVYTLSSLWRCI